MAYANLQGHDMKDWTLSSSHQYTTKENPTIYIQVHDNDNFIILAIYVDNGIVVTPNLVLDAKLWTLLKKEFEMTYKSNIYLLLVFELSVIESTNGFLFYKIII
jgi:hypothetical protein